MVSRGGKFDGYVLLFELHVRTRQIITKGNKKLDLNTGTIALNMWFEGGLRSKIISEPKMLPFYIRSALREMLSEELRKRIELQRKSSSVLLKTRDKWRDIIDDDKNLDGLTATMLTEELDAMSDSGMYTKSHFDLILGDGGATKLLSMREEYSKSVLRGILATYNIITL